MVISYGGVKLNAINNRYRPIEDWPFFDFLVQPG